MMKLYREDGRDIGWITPKISRLIVSALYLTPILMGMILKLAWVGLLIFMCYLPLMIVLLLTFDICHAKYVGDQFNMSGDGI